MCDFDLEDIKNILSSKKIKLNGCFHVGAHDCEEINLYNNLGIKNEDIIWVEAVLSKVNESRSKGIPNVFNALITDKDDEEVGFNISDDCNSGRVASSSIFEFGTHQIEHPWITFVDKIYLKSITIDTFFERNNLDASKYDIWNFDIQGAELLALKGATKSIQHAKVLLLEVNSKELYINCAKIDEIDNFLEQYNFKRIMTNMTVHGWGDAMYILNT
jgi:hypothetical protein